MSDPIIETPPPIEVEVWAGSGGAPLSADTPEDLGTASAGVSVEASRSDHVHAMPSAGDVGADVAGAAAAVAGDLSTHESLTTTAHGGIVGDTDARLTDARTPLAHTHGQSDVTGLVADMAGKQPLDSDLTAIAALSTTAFGRSLLEVVDAAGGRAALSAAAASHVHSGADITSGVVAPARLGSGTASAGRVLTSDGTAASWQPTRWKAPDGAGSGLYYGNPSMSEAYHSVGIYLTARGIPVWVPVGTVANFAVNAGGTSSRQLRIFMYPANPSTGRPDGEALICESGVFTVSATGWLEFVTSGTVAPSGPFTDFVPVWVFIGSLSADAHFSNTLYGYGNNAMAFPMWNGVRSSSQRDRWMCRFFTGLPALPAASPAICPTTSATTAGVDIKVNVV